MWGQEEFYDLTGRNAWPKVFRDPNQISTLQPFSQKLQDLAK